MAAPSSAVAPSLPSPIVGLVCGLLLMLGGAILYWLEPGPAPIAAHDTVAPETAAARLERTRQREALQRAEFERKAAEETAERARRAELQADAAAEAEARRQRAELAELQAAAEAARRAAAESEEAWKRFYRPSERCRSPEGATSVECVNEYVKARREFAAPPVGR